MTRSKYSPELKMQVKEVFATGNASIVACRHEI